LRCSSAATAAAPEPTPISETLSTRMLCRARKCRTKKSDEEPGAVMPTFCPLMVSGLAGSNVVLSGPASTRPELRDNSTKPTTSLCLAYIWMV